jgi:hypothetical protein
MLKKLLTMSAALLLAATPLAANASQSADETARASKKSGPGVAASAAKRTVYAPKDCTKPRVEPGRIVIACGDFGLYFKVKRWAYWNRSGAAANARMRANDCTPSCAAGTFHSYTVRIRLSKVRTRPCNGRRVPMFQKLRANFKDRRPAWAGGREKFGLWCAP